MLPYEQRLADAKGVYAAGMERVATTPAPKGQKFPVGSFVRIGKLPACMSHFPSNTPAKVEHTYAHAYGGKDVKSYSLLVKEEDRWDSVAWFEENQLTQITNKKVIAGYEAEIAEQP
jgi:hypothetical protein